MTVKQPNQLDLDQVDLISLDYDGKVKTLQAICQQLLDVRLEFAQVSGRYAELRAEIQVLKEVKSALQSAIRAEGQ